MLIIIFGAQKKLSNFRKAAVFLQTSKQTETIPSQLHPSMHPNQCLVVANDYKPISCNFCMWPRQESNLDLELRKLLYYPLYYEANIFNEVQR